MTAEPPTSAQFIHAFLGQPCREQLGADAAWELRAGRGGTTLVASDRLPETSDAVPLPALRHVVQAALTHPCLCEQARHPDHGDNGSHVAPSPWSGLCELSPARQGYPEQAPVTGAIMECSATG